MITGCLPLVQRLHQIRCCLSRWILKLNTCCYT